MPDHLLKRMVGHKFSIIVRDCLRLFRQQHIARLDPAFFAEQFRKQQIEYRGQYDHQQDNSDIPERAGSIMKRIEYAH